MKYPQINNLFLRDQIFEAIKEMIINNELRPGTSIQVEKLASIFHVSPTPIREALLRLENLEFISIQKNKSAIVTPITTKKVCDIWEHRKLLEFYCIGILIKEPLIAELDKLEANLNYLLYHPSDFEAYRQPEINIHDIEIKYCGNDSIASSLNDILSHYLRLRFFAEQTTQQKEDLILEATKEHLKILDAIKKRDSFLAKKELENHLENAKNRTLLAIKSQSENI